nr:hypothetical protein [Tanacetum cinerariifolium]
KLNDDGDDVLLDVNENDSIEPKSEKGWVILKKKRVDERLIEKIDISFALTINVHMILSRQRWMTGNSKPEWSRFVTIEKQQHKLDEVSYHKLFDILKQYQNEVNELRAEKLAMNANPLALVATAQANRDPYYQTSRIVNVAGTREKVGSPVVQKSGIQCFNCKEYGHFAKECRKPKRVKDSTYHKEKMLLCKQAEQGVSLQAEQYDWLADTNEEVDKQELEAHYSYMAKIQEVPNADSGIDFEPVEQNDQNDVESDDERVVLANLIANLKLDVNENKKIQKQLKKANTTLAQVLKECKAILAKTSKSLVESISVRDSCLVALQTKQTEFEKYKAFNDRTIDYDKLKRKLNEALGQLAQKDTVIREGLKMKAYEHSVVKEKHGELMKQGLLTKSHYEGLVKQKMKVITDLKLSNVRARDHPTNGRAQRGEERGGGKNHVFREVAVRILSELRE